MTHSEPLRPGPPSLTLPEIYNLPGICSGLTGEHFWGTRGVRARCHSLYWVYKEPAKTSRFQCSTEPCKDAVVKSCAWKYKEKFLKRYRRGMGQGVGMFSMVRMKEAFRWEEFIKPEEGKTSRKTRGNPPSLFFSQVLFFQNHLPLIFFWWLISCVNLTGPQGIQILC